MPNDPMVRVASIRATAGPVPPGRGSALTYDRESGLVILFGGIPESRGDQTAGLSVWDGSSWNELADTSQLTGRRTMPMLSYLGARSLTVLFGGVPREPAADTWTLSLK